MHVALGVHWALVFVPVLLMSVMWTVLFARLANRRGWTDAPTESTRARKLQRLGVPPVGGAAILAALFPSIVLAAGWASDEGWDVMKPFALGGPLSLFLLLAVGLRDDLFVELTAWRKLGLQALALLPFALSAASVAPSEDSAFAHASAIAFGFAALTIAVVAVNVVNTFDNADGAVVSVAAIGFFCVELFASPSMASLPVLAALLGFLLFNLDAGAPWNARSDAPTAYLGDSGAFVIGFLILFHPEAWPALWIPALDLARLAVVRIEAGSRPWIGDRRHLAHRLQARGLPPVLVVAVLAVLTAPACLGVHVGESPFVTGPAGFAFSTLLFAVALKIAPATQDPCPRPDAPE